jgi:hypothetical protein
MRRDVFYLNKTWRKQIMPMKCIKAIKGTPNVPVGTIQRLADKEADRKVNSGYFIFISKSEWKAFKNEK